MDFRVSDVGLIGSVVLSLMTSLSEVGFLSVVWRRNGAADGLAVMETAEDDI